MTAAECSCSEDRPHEIARRLTADGVGLVLWSDGALAGVLGFKLRGVPMRQPRTPEARDLALRAGWLLLGEVELWDAEEIGDLYRAAERAARRDGLPGTLRALMAEQARPRLELRWTVTAADRDGRPTERQVHLPRLRWPGWMVIDFCGSTFSGPGRYQIFRLETNRTPGCREFATAAYPTGLAFRSQRALAAFLFSEDGQTRVTTERAPGAREE